MTTIGLDVIIALVIGTYGALVSTYSIVYTRQQNKRKIKVTLQFGALIMNKAIPKLILTAINTGDKPVTLTGMGLILPRKENNYFAILQPNTMGLVTFPHDLESGKNCSVYLDHIEFADQLRAEGFSGKIKMKGYFRDATGEYYKGKKFPFDLSKK